MPQAFARSMYLHRLHHLLIVCLVALFATSLQPRCATWLLAAGQELEESAPADESGENEESASADEGLLRRRSFSLNLLPTICMTFAAAFPGRLSVLAPRSAPHSGALAARNGCGGPLRL